jgi:uncharacterized membrane protein YgaE (UPF0421/DUF939 family)
MVCSTYFPEISEEAKCFLKEQFEACYIPKTFKEFEQSALLLSIINLEEIVEYLYTHQ